MIKKILITLVAIIAAILIYAATRPDSFRVERTTTIKAPPEKIFPLIDDYHQWSAWSPWEKLDPAMQRTYSGPASGKGAIYEWSGNKDVGKGRMEITESTAPTHLAINLDFLEPFEAHNKVDFTLTPQGDSTTVTWAMHGPMPYISKVICIFVSMDKMIGKDFEAGLANLKAAAEK